MNGCCPTNVEGPGHGPECYWYWPCGCRKQRPNPHAKAQPHTHTTKYVEPAEALK